jgi:hypothetical protein
VLLEQHRDDFDETYLADRARREDIEDILADLRPR